ncbi:MAG: hypothetical protein OHK0048_22100 [Rhodoferax sp.]
MFTDREGFSRFRDEAIVLDRGDPQALLSQALACRALVFRQSPVGFRSDFHCTTDPQWCFILQGCMEIGLRDGSSRRFPAGTFFYSTDTLPDGQAFDPSRHGHWSRQLGPSPLVTVFVRT